MGTHDRRPFVSRAIRCFLEQQAPDLELELIVVDDGVDAVRDLIPDDPRIKYHHTQAKLSLQEKRQATYELATGEILVLWDDDDWHGPERVARQAHALSRKHEDFQACLLDPILFHEVERDRTWRWAARGRYQMCVGTLAFTRAYYARRPGGFPAFRETHSDQQFVRDRPWALVTYVEGEDCYVAVRHAGNGSGCVITPGGPWSHAPSASALLID